MYTLAVTVLLGLAVLTVVDAFADLVPGLSPRRGVLSLALAVVGAFALDYSMFEGFGVALRESWMGTLLTGFVVASHELVELSELSEVLSERKDLHHLLPLLRRTVQLSAGHGETCHPGSGGHVLGTQAQGLAKMSFGPLEQAPTALQVREKSEQIRLVGRLGRLRRGRRAVEDLRSLGEVSAKLKGVGVASRDRHPRLPPVREVECVHLFSVAPELGERIYPRREPHGMVGVDP